MGAGKLEGGEGLMIHILVVEDDERLNQAVCRCLSDARYSVTGCLNVQDAYD